MKLSVEIHGDGEFIETSSVATAASIATFVSFWDFVRSFDYLRRFPLASADLIEQAPSRSLISEVAAILAEHWLDENRLKGEE